MQTRNQEKTSWFPILKHFQKTGDEQLLLALHLLLSTRPTRGCEVVPRFRSPPRSASRSSSAPSKPTASGVRQGASEPGLGWTLGWRTPRRDANQSNISSSISHSIGWETPGQNKCHHLLPWSTFKPNWWLWMCPGPHSYQNALGNAPDEPFQAAPAPCRSLAGVCRVCTEGSLLMDAAAVQKRPYHSCCREYLPDRFYFSSQPFNSG